MRVGLTGANGFVGSHIAAAVRAAGHELRILVRKSSRMAWLDGIERQTVVGDVRDAACLAAFAEGLDAVIHCAGLTIGNSRELNQSNVAGTAQLIDAVRAHAPGLRRFVYISSQEAIGINPDPERLVDESDPPRPITDYGRSKLQAENLVRAADWLPWTIIRPSPVYGPRDKDTYLFFQAAALRLKPVAFFPGRLSLIYVENLAAGIVQAMESPRALGQVYFMADEPNYSWTGLTGGIEKATVRHRMVLPLGKSLLYAITALSAAYGLVSGQRVILNRQKYLMLTAPNLGVDAAKARRDFYRQGVAAPAAFAATYRWYKDAGWL